MELKERLARALCEVDGMDPNDNLEGSPIWDHYEDHVSCVMDTLANLPLETIDSLCLTYRHDFGLLPDDEKNMVRAQAKAWINTIVAHGMF